MPKRITEDQMIAEQIAELKQSFANWDEIKENGTSDPAWPDGVNINLVRNHIIFHKREIERLSAGQLFPPDDPIMDKPVPPEMPNDWMAKPRCLGRYSVFSVEQAA